MTKGRAASENACSSDRETEAALKQSEERFRLLLDQARDCFFVHDLQGRIIDVNQQACKSLGYTRKELLKCTVADIDVGIEPEVLSKNFQTLASGESLTVEGTHRRKDGTTFPVEITASLLEQEGDKYVLAIARDITERKETEEEWKRNSDRLEELVRERTAERALAYGHLDILRRNTIQMTSTLDVQKVLNTTVRGLVEGSQAALARIWLVGPGDACAECRNEPFCENQRICLHIRASAGLTENLEGDRRRIPFEVTKIGKIAQSRKADCISDVLNDHDSVDKDWVRANKLKSFAGYPLIFKDELLGVLALFSRHTFGKEEFEGLGVFANQGAIAIKNARLYSEAEQLKNRLEAENVYLQEEIKLTYNFAEIIGRSTSLKKVLRKVEQVAATDATVLISGETGTGKELIARAIHDSGSRNGRALVKVDCGAISAGLVESELFGHEKGAFTGAQDRHIGRFELADHGTIFLDEVGELPQETQVKLLRIIQDHEFERVGGNKPIQVDVRIIAATNRDLSAAAEQGRFRSDLYYRLNVFPIHVPPLRERKTDIPLLLRYFLGRTGKKLGKEINRIPSESMEQLMAYSWPGNVRELQNVVERAAIVTPGSVLHFDEFPDIRPGGKPGTGATTGTLDEVDRRHILQTLEQTDWVIDGPGGAALILGLHPNTLRTRMKKLGIRRPGRHG